MARADGTVSLPTDTPPSNRAVIGAEASTFVGTRQEGSLGQIDVPLYTRPWTPWQSSIWPNVLNSSVAANLIRPSWLIAKNSYSPIAHRNPLTTVTPPRAIPGRGVAVPTQRPRPYAAGWATRWPMVAPQWPTYAESPQAGA